MPKPAVLAALAGVLVTSCTASQWQRPDTDAAVLDADIRQCENDADAYAWRLASSGDKPAVVVSPRGEAGVTRSPYVVPPIDPVVQNDFFNSCMRKKGYRPASR